MAIATNLGYPRFGPQRALKWTHEKYWRGRTNAKTLHHLGCDLRHAQQRLQQQLGIQHIPANDFSLYDHVLDTIALVGAVPERYGWHGDTVDLTTYFAMARGLGPRISILDLQGQVLARLGNLPRGEGLGQFITPHGVGLDSHGDIYVAEVAWTAYGSQFTPPREVRSLQKLVRQGV